MTGDRQLEFPFSSTDGAQTPPVAATSLQKPADTPHGVLTLPAVPIPRRCPVTGGRICYRDGCTHFHSELGGRCSHPVAVAAKRSRRPSRHR